MSNKKLKANKELYKEIYRLEPETPEYVIYMMYEHAEIYGSGKEIDGKGGQDNVYEEYGYEYSPENASEVAPIVLSRIRENITEKDMEDYNPDDGWWHWSLLLQKLEEDGEEELLNKAMSHTPPERLES